MEPGLENHVSLSQRPEHKRSKSSSVLKSILISAKTKPSTSDVNRPNPAPFTPLSKAVRSPYDAVSDMATLRSDEFQDKVVLGELAQSPGRKVFARRRTSTKQRKPVAREITPSNMAQTSPKQTKGDDPRADADGTKESSKGRRFKRSKSSTSLSAIFKSTRGREKFEDVKDKENTTPPSSPGRDATTYTPGWAQVATTQMMREVTTTTTVPLNDQRTIAHEIALYTPVDYSPTKQRNFPETQPTLGRRSDRGPRPKSAIFLPGRSKSPRAQPLSGRSSLDRPERENARSDTRQEPTRSGDKEKSRSKSRSRARSLFKRSSKEDPKISIEERNVCRNQTGIDVVGDKRHSRVMSAVVAIDNKAKVAGVEDVVCDKDLDKAFEAVLDARNISENMRAKLRSLEIRIKQDFIRQDKQEGLETPKSSKDGQHAFAMWDDATSKTSPWVKSADPGSLTGSEGSVESPNKRGRTLNKAFILGKADDSSCKKHKYATSKDGSVSIPKSASSRSLAALAGNGSTDALVRAPKPAAPEEFVDFLREAQKPEAVEVGKLHKLRLLLRNETVGWVDSFISRGGNTEIVGLLHRIMQVEWREEHEDALLHETLLCLKGLCTTSLGLRNLCRVESTLFPALLTMLFDEERKGPSDFTTRAIIIHVLFAHLENAPPPLAAARARTILAYLADPKPEESARPAAFIADMHQPRPYRVWCKEVVSVTKEVFWIFLHHLNVITPEPTDFSAPSNPLSTSPSASNTHPQPSYRALFFPLPRPPVPAAPYIGGVEWDATSYLAVHLDLLNAIIASLPTATERNRLRSELRASGFEKAMGTSLRTCKEKFYASVHAGLRTWVAAGRADGWAVDEVREGPPRGGGSPAKSPVKARDEAPRLEAPRLELRGLSLGLGSEMGQRRVEDGGWLS